MFSQASYKRCLCAWCPHTGDMHDENDKIKIIWNFSLIWYNIFLSVLNRVSKIRSSLIQGIIFNNFGVLNRVRVRMLWRHVPVDRRPKYPPRDFNIIVVIFFKRQTVRIRRGACYIIEFYQANFLRKLIKWKCISDMKPKILYFSLCWFVLWIEWLECDKMFQST